LFVEEAEQALSRSQTVQVLEQAQLKKEEVRGEEPASIHESRPTSKKQRLHEREQSHHEHQI